MPEKYGVFVGHSPVPGAKLYYLLREVDSRTGPGKAWEHAGWYRVEEVEKMEASGSGLQAVAHCPTDLDPGRFCPVPGLDWHHVKEYASLTDTERRFVPTPPHEGKSATDAREACL